MDSIPSYSTYIWTSLNVSVYMNIFVSPCDGRCRVCASERAGLQRSGQRAGTDKGSPVCSPLSTCGKFPVSAVPGGLALWGGTQQECERQTWPGVPAFNHSQRGQSRHVLKGWSISIHRFLFVMKKGVISKTKSIQDMTSCLLTFPSQASSAASQT